MGINSVSAAILAILSVIFAVNEIHITVFVSYVVSRITANVAGGITAVAVNVICSCSCLAAGVAGGVACIVVDVTAYLFFPNSIKGYSFVTVY